MNFRSICLLLSLSHAGSVSALGLGDLNVRSHLGQPLHATVKILAPGPTTAADCFSLSASQGAMSPPPRSVQLSYESGGTQPLLHLRTRDRIYDPIVQFELVSDCEARLRRDYVILLDPPSTAELIAPPARVSAAVTPEAAPKPAAPKPAPKPRKTPRKPDTLARPASVSAPATTADRSPSLADSTPRLVLSGRNGSASSALALRLDTNLPDLTRPLPDDLTPDEISDENTALTRKLAYLETQLAALHKRNAELEAKRGTQASTSPESTGQWPLYLLAVGLVAAAVLLVAWLRARSRQSRNGYVEEWQPTGPMENLDLDRLESSPWKQPQDDTLQPAKTHPGKAQSGEGEPTAVAPESVVEPSFEIVPPTMNRSTVVKEDIIDQAEVYVAHGHGDLAIHMLQEHLRDHPPDSPTPWLLLLDLLHREGDTENYAAASAECRRHFNINLSGHPISQDNQIGRGLESYPHLTDKLVDLWGTPEIEAFFEDLIFDKRGGTRIGFEPCAYREIMLLRAISRDTAPFAATPSIVT